MKDSFEMSERERRYWLKQFGVKIDDEAPILSQNPIITAQKPQKMQISSLRLNNVNNSDRETFAKLKKGKLPIQAKLDLHGYRLHEAKEEFYSFIKSAAEIGLRVVLVVTGKGNFTGGIGKIKSDLPNWFNDPDLKQCILTCCSAPVNMGGEGATLFLLRRG